MPRYRIAPDNMAPDGPVVELADIFTDESAETFAAQLLQAYAYPIAIIVPAREPQRDDDPR